MTKTMLNVAYDFLKALEDNQNFELIWSEVNKNATTIKEKPTKSEVEKKAELYKLLILDGRFIRDENGNWGLVEKQTYQSLQKMKAFYAKEDIKD